MDHFFSQNGFDFCSHTSLLEKLYTLRGLLHTVDAYGDEQMLRDLKVQVVVGINGRYSIASLTRHTQMYISAVCFEMLRDELVCLGSLEGKYVIFNMPCGLSFREVNNIEPIERFKIRNLRQENEQESRNSAILKRTNLLQQQNTGVSLSLASCSYDTQYWTGNTIFNQYQLTQNATLEDSSEERNPESSASTQTIKKYIWL